MPSGPRGPWHLLGDLFGQGPDHGPADAAVIVREGHGTGEAHGASAGEVHDRALKTAETDATKRALATFGKAFGLALYAGLRQRVNAGDKNASAGRSKNASGGAVGRPRWGWPSGVW